MKVKDAIRMINEYYQPEDEIFIAWWDKDSAEAITREKLTDQQWEDMVEFFDTDEHLFIGVQMTIEEAYEHIKEVG